MPAIDTISFIGCGNVGRTLARALRNAGYRIGFVICRHPKSAKEAVEFIGAGEGSTDLVSALSTGSVHFVATNDDAIAGVVQDLDQKGPASLEGHVFFHTSGSISSTVFEPLVKKGADAASIHPLQVFADPGKALETLPGIHYAIEGTDRAMALAVQLVDKLQGKLLLIPTDRKALYHAAGVFVANYLTVLIDFALSIMEDLGETPEDSYQAFLPLMVGALQNVEEFGTADALTGPISRGDIKTIKSHMEALHKLRPEILNMYRVLGRAAVDLAVRSRKIPADKAHELQRILKES